MKHISTKTKEKYQIDEIREKICDLVIQGKLDAIDLQVIAERDCSPMPTMREVALRIGITHGTVENRLAKIERLLTGHSA